MASRVWFLITTVFALAIGFMGWYLRPVLQARVVGVAWRYTLRHSHCVRSRGETSCTTNWPVVSDTVSYTTVQLSPITRTIHRINRTRLFADSVSWRRVLDSTRAAMAARHSERLTCDGTEAAFPVAEAWRFGSQEVRLYAGHVRQPTSRQPPWFASIQLVPLGGAGCGPRVVRRLLTPAEMGRAARLWLAEQLGFDAPPL